MKSRGGLWFGIGLVGLALILGAVIRPSLKRLHAESPKESQEEARGDKFEPIDFGFKPDRKPAEVFVAAPAIVKSAKVTPSAAGKFAAVIESENAGKWIVLSSNLLPIQPQVYEDNKLCVFEGAAGQYAVIMIPPGDGQPVVTPVTLGGAGPVPPTPVPPGPTPPGPNPPGPTPPPVPTPKQISVLITYEQAKLRQNREYQNIINSSKIKAYLDTHCMMGPDGVTPEYRLYDVNQTLTTENQKWKDAMNLPRQSDFSYAITNGTTGISGVLPKTEEEFLAILKQWGGA